MKLAILTASVSRKAGGLYQSVRYSSQALAELGIDLAAFGTRDALSEADLSSWSPLKPSITRAHGPGALAWSPQTSRLLARFSPDVVHVHGLWQGPSITSLLHHWIHRVPFLVSPRGMLDSWALARSSWKKRMAAVVFEGRHLRDASCLHALCASEAESIRAYGLKNAVCVIPNGVEIPEARAEGLDSIEPKCERKTLLYLGRIHPKKGLPNALRAWAGIRHHGGRRQSDWQFVIAGWDQIGHETELKMLCRDLGLDYADVPAADFVSDNRAQNCCSPASVVFTGPAFGEEKAALLRQASAFMLPSFSEGLPMSVLEAWSYGLPVLMTDHCNLPEGFAANAALRIGTDVDSITAGLEELLQSTTNDQQSLGRNGRALVERQFTWPQVAAQMKEVYEWVVEGGVKPECVETGKSRR